MIARLFALLTLALFAAALANPANAKKKAPVDPDEQVCELEWRATFGDVALKQTYSGAGELVWNELSIQRVIPSSDGYGKISISRFAYKGSPAQLDYRLGLGGPITKGKSQRLSIAMPDGAPMVLNMQDGATFIPIGEAELTRLIAAGRPLNYRMIKVDGKGRETRLLGQGWLDLSGFGGQELAGLPKAAELAETILAQARKGAKPPCVMAWAAEMNSVDSSEAVRRALSFDCGEEWDSPLGRFSIGERRFFWTPPLQDGMGLQISGEIQVAPRADLQRFIDLPRDSFRYGQITVSLNRQEWGLNYRAPAPPERERQIVELHDGNSAVRATLNAQAEARFYWNQLVGLSEEGVDLDFRARDLISGAQVSRTLPWAQVTAAEAELRAGQARLREREADPLNRCKANVEEEFGQEDMIVT